jgi:Zn finger protein HypA/HybF involved in hydrogenase expression
VEELADKKYKEMFRNDEGHLLIIFREYPNASSNYICTATPGYDAETQVMDDQAREILLDYIDYYYTEESFNEGQFFERAFTSAADRIMIKQLSTKQLAAIVIVVIVVVIGIIIVASIIRKKKVAVAKQKALQKQAEAQQAKAVAAQKQTEFNQQKYNDELETQYVAVECPNCGSTGNKIRRTTVGYCPFCGTAIKVDEGGNVTFINRISAPET